MGTIGKLDVDVGGTWIRLYSMEMLMILELVMLDSSSRTRRNACSVLFVAGCDLLIIDVDILHLDGWSADLCVCLGMSEVSEEYMLREIAQDVDVWGECRDEHGINLAPTESRSRAGTRWYIHLRPYNTVNGNERNIAGRVCNSSLDCNV